MVSDRDQQPPGFMLHGRAGDVMGQTVQVKECCDYVWQILVIMLVWQILLIGGCTNMSAQTMRCNNNTEENFQPLSSKTFVLFRPVHSAQILLNQFYLRDNCFDAIASLAPSISFQTTITNYNEDNNGEINYKDNRFVNKDDDNEDSNNYKCLMWYCRVLPGPLSVTGMALVLDRVKITESW